MKRNTRAPTSRSSFLCTFVPWCLCAFLLLLSLSAAASPPPASILPAADADKPQLFLQFGWSGRVDPDRWTPVRITVQGGAEPFAGAVVIEHPQDPTQTAAVTIPVTATPGRTTEVTAALSLPSTCERITARLIDDRGRPIRLLTYTRSPSPLDHPLPDFVLGFEPVTAAVSPGRGTATPTSPFSADGAAAGIQLLDHLSAARSTGVRFLNPAPRRPIHPADLPMTWAAYDGVSILAIDADASAAADPRSIAAVREWVTGGGRLLIVAAAPGNAWRAWLPPSHLGDLITIDEPIRAPIPPDLAAVVTQAEARAAQEEADFTALQQAAANAPGGAVGAYGPFRPLRGAQNNASQQPQGSLDAGEEANAPDQADQPAADAPATTLRPADTATQRPIRLTPRGRDSGWRLRWRPDAAPPEVAWIESPGAPPPADATGLLAEGPVGLGWVTVITIDPRRVSASPSDTATRAVWKDATAVALAQRQRLADVAAGSPWGSWYAWSEENAARSAVLNELTSAPGAGRGSFFIIVAAMIGLALLMGPIDAVLLHRLRVRHRSWFTSLLWISLATLAAYMAPALSRSSTDELARLSTVDVLVPPAAAGGAAEPAHALAWQTSITGVFAGRSMHAAITPVPATDGAVPAHWWRGFSAIHYSYYTGDRIIGPPVQTVQTLPDLGSVDAAADPWGGWGNGRRVHGSASPDENDRAPAPVPGGATMMPTPLRTWTFRSFEDQARTPPPCTAILRQGDDGEPVVEVIGLPAGARVASAACRIGSHWHDLTFDPARPSGDAPLSARLGPPHGNAPHAWSPPPLKSLEPWTHHLQPVSFSEIPAVAFLFGAPQKRALAAETLLNSRRWAAVYLHLENMPSDVVLTPFPRRDDPARSTRTVVCRILTPLPETPLSILSPGDTP